MTNATTIRLKRYAGHWRWGVAYIVGGNLVIAGGLAGLSAMMEATSVARSMQILLSAAALVAIVSGWVMLMRRASRRIIPTIELSASDLTLVNVGRRIVIPRRAIRWRRLAYLSHMSGGIGYEHQPVLEIAGPDGFTIRIAGGGMRAWSEIDAPIDSTPPYTVDARDWAALCTLLEPP